MQHCDYFDYWGRGTQVTVSAEKNEPPTLFPLVQCIPDTADKIKVGCLANDFYPESLTFQWTDASGNPVKSLQYPPLKKANKYTGISFVELPKSDWDSGSFQCSVTYPGGNQTMKVKNNKSAPKVTLQAMPRPDAQELVCTIEDFTSKELSVKWKKDAVYVTDFTYWAPQMSGNLYSAISVLKVSNTDWESEAVYTCEVTHQNKPYKDTAKKEVPITMTLNQPSAKEIFNNNQAKLECTITGQDQSTLSEIKIAWQIDGKTVTNNVKETTMPKGGKHSIMTQNRTEWQKVSKVRCSAIREDKTLVKQDLTVHKGGGSDPKVTVHVLPEEDINKDSVTLVCLVSSTVLQDYYIAWSEDTLKQNGNYVDGINFPPQKTQLGYSVASIYTTTEEKWKGHNKFSCNVWPAGSEKPMSPKEVSMSLSNSNFTPESKLSFALSCTDDAIEEDEYSSLWSTASSFIFLFISSLLYSMIFSLVKMKRP